MNKQICRACGYEMVTQSVVPMTFCTNCGASLSYPSANNFVVYQPGATGRGKRRFNSGEKIMIGAVIAVPLLLIVGGIGFAVFLFYAASRADYDPPRYPTPNSTPYSARKDNAPPNRLLSFGGDGLTEGKFKNASALAVDRSGNIYVGDGSLRVQKFDAEGKFLQMWNVREANLTTDEKYTRGINHLAIDSKGTVYVAVDSHELFRYDSAGKFIDKIPLYGEKWMNKQQEARILDLQMLSDDKLAVYATSFPDGEYLMLVSPEGKSEIKHKSLLKKQDENPIIVSRVGLMIAPTGDILLLNGKVASDKAYVYRYKADGTYVDRFTWEGAPMSVNVGSETIGMNSKGEIFAYNGTKKQVSVLSLEGVATRNIPLETGSFRKMVIDSGDNIYALGSDKVEKFTSTGY